MNESCLISIIIPVYNVENYLKVCIDSILNQDFKDYEIILVDDGSTDNSGKICDEYAESYYNIKVKHKQNGGLSDARNVGLLLANGDYILFVDSDDYIGESSLKEISKCVTETDKVIDVVFLEAKKIFPDGRCVSLDDGYVESEINGKNKTHVMKHLASLSKYPGSACTKLIKKSVILDNKLFFEKDLLCEDIDWTIRLFLNAETFAYCGVDYYFYRQSREGSITNTVNIKNVKSLLSIIKKWASKDLSNSFQIEINSFLAYEYMILLYNFDKLNKNQKKELYSEFKEYSWVLNYAQTTKTKIAKFLVKIMGIRVTAFLLHLHRG